MSAPVVWASSPSLGSVTPRGVQRGTEAVIFFNGGRLADAQEIFFYSPGLAVAKLEVVNDGQVKVTVNVAADCRLGEHGARVRTASGISETRTFWVGALPNVDEKEPNSDFAAPQPINLGVTVTGVADNEDVDYYVVDAKKGQRISAEVEGMRLGTTLFDPYVAIMDAKRFELAACDDSALVWQDAVASVVAPEDGKYIIQVRESSYAGNGACTYRLHVGTFPRPTAILPAGGKFGEEVDVKFLGDVTGEFTRKIKLPAEPQELYAIHAQDETGIAPSGNPFRLCDFGNVIEAEPNNDQPTSTVGPAPIAFNGVIAQAGDVDFFRFKAAKGQVFDIHCFARRIRSPLDSVMYVYHFGGGAIAGNDDGAGPDSYIRFTAPEDKEYAISVTDHLGKGGPNYAYRIEVSPVKPGVEVSIPRVARYSQERQNIPVPRGNRYATLVSATRRDWGGDLVLEAKDLPAGITMAAEAMPANLSTIPVLFEAAADAPIGGKLIDFPGRHVDPNANIRGGTSIFADLIIGPNQAVMWGHTTTKLPVAVTEEVPFKISLVEPKVPLVQNGSMNLKVVAERKEGFKAPITLQMPFLPPGVGAASSVAIPEGQNEALYPVNANGGAQIRDWKVVVIGTSDVKGPVWVSTQLATLKVAAPYVAFNMERAATEQGKETDLVCKVQHATPFDGPAKVRVLGLPHKVAAPEMDLARDQAELVFKVTTATDSPAGIHKNIFCQLVITQNGEPVVHNVGGTELRIDQPLPPKPNAPPPPPMPVAQAAPPPMPAKPPEKRLTRLEQLRLEQQERAKAAGK